MQAAGPENVGFVTDPLMQKTVPTIDKDVRDAIHRWYYDRFFLHSKFGLIEESSILEIFDYAAKRYDCKVFLVDNLMTTVIDEGAGNFYREQSKFVQKLADFAHLHNVHIHLVAHPRKGELEEMDDVGGTGDITKRADNVLIMKRREEGSEARA